MKNQEETESQATIVERGFNSPRFNHPSFSLHLGHRRTSRPKATEAKGSSSSTSQCKHIDGDKIKVKHKIRKKEYTLRIKYNLEEKDNCRLNMNSLT